MDVDKLKNARVSAYAYDVFARNYGYKNVVTSFLASAIGVEDLQDVIVERAAARSKFNYAKFPMAWHFIHPLMRLHLFRLPPSLYILCAYCVIFLEWSEIVLTTLVALYHFTKYAQRLR